MIVSRHVRATNATKSVLAPLSFFAVTPGVEDIALQLVPYYRERPKSSVIFDGTYRYFLGPAIYYRAPPYFRYVLQRTSVIFDEYLISTYI